MNRSNATNAPARAVAKVAPADEPLERHERIAYEDLVRGRYPIVLIRKMYEANLRVVKVGDEYADGAKQRGKPIKGIPETDTVLYDFDLAERVKLCAPQPSNSLEEARTAYNLPRSGPARVVERTVCWRIPIDGPITGETVEQVKRRVRRALRARVNVLI